MGSMFNMLTTSLIWTVITSLHFGKFLGKDAISRTITIDGAGPIRRFTWTKIRTLTKTAKIRIHFLGGNSNSCRMTTCTTPTMTKLQQLIPIRTSYGTH